MAFLTRRTFLNGTATLAAASAAQPLSAIEPIDRPGRGRMRLSLSAYSMRRFFRAKPDDPEALSILGFVDWAATLDLDAVEPTSYFFPKQVTPGYLAKLKRRCHVAGLDISGGAIGNNFTYPDGDKLEKQFDHVKTWIDHYAALGAPVIRVFAGRPPKGVSIKQAIDRAIRNLNRACGMAGKRGIMLAVENHDFLTDVDRMMAIVKGVESPWFGVNFDSGNFHSANPYADLERVAPYAVNVQIKVHVRRKGQSSEPADLGRVIGILREADYAGPVALEYEASEDPYKAIPRYLAELRKHIEG